MANLTTLEIYRFQYPDSTVIGVTNPTDPQLTTYIELVSEVVQKYLNRDLQSLVRSEWHNTFDDNVIITNEYPITQVYGIIGGKEEWAQLRLIESGDNVSLSFYYDTVNNTPTIDVIINMESISSLTISEYSTIDEVMVDIQTYLTSQSITSTYTTNTAYATQNLVGLQSLSQTQGNFNSIFSFFGVDKTNTTSWTQEGERNIIMNQKIRSAVNSVLLKYEAGYELPIDSPEGSSSTAGDLDYGTLPRPIIDVVNRIIHDILTNDLSGNGTDMTMKSEKLGNASFTNWDYDQARRGTFIDGLIERYVEQLMPYKRKDVAFF